MRSLFMPLALCASLPVFAQSQSLVVCSEAAPEGFDIVQYTAATTADASAETVYERLVQFAPGSTRIIPALAESWEISADGLTYTFTLRDGVICSDTNPFEPDSETLLPPKHKNMGKSSMSFLTALSLSFNNLRTKKARTLLTSFAGSIGIIGGADGPTAIFVTSRYNAQVLWGLAVKVFSNVLVILLNYVFSKLIIFKKKQ